MCDYSLHALASRPAKAGDRLVTTGFVGTTTRGFCAIGEPETAVCLLPGTELAFAKEPERDGPLASLLLRWGFGRIGSKVARMRKLQLSYAHTHHDALEFANGKILYLTTLRPGAEATVLQLPASWAKLPADQNARTPADSAGALTDAPVTDDAVL